MERIPESMAADALNAIRLSKDPLRDEEKEGDEVNVVGNQSSSRTMTSASGPKLELKKSKAPQGRRSAGSSTPLRISSAQVDVSELNSVQRRAVAALMGDFDQEAQVGR
jgi:hypothetical protein